MSKRRVGRRTVVDAVRRATRSLEEAIAKAVRCPLVTQNELVAMRVNWRDMDELTERLARKPRRR